MSNPRITTQQSLRIEFWERFPELVCNRNRRNNPKPQNQQPADTRMAWVDFVDSMQKSGDISEALAYRATL